MMIGVSRRARTTLVRAWMVMVLFAAIEPAVGQEPQPAEGNEAGQGKPPKTAGISGGKSPSRSAAYDVQLRLARKYKRSGMINESITAYEKAILAAPNAEQRTAAEKELDQLIRPWPRILFTPTTWVRWVAESSLTWLFALMAPIVLASWIRGLVARGRSTGKIAVHSNSKNLSPVYLAHTIQAVLASFQEQANAESRIARRTRMSVTPTPLAGQSPLSIHALESVELDQGWSLVLPLRIVRRIFHGTSANFRVNAVMSRAGDDVRIRTSVMARAGKQSRTWDRAGSLNDAENLVADVAYDLLVFLQGL